ncbi:sensor histidine kinase (plasmid) [Streptomyces sp. BI20]|uniref:sensor histidine kinase n=1 Tax=Streptomyces sp. BI20 TaxID=3403460 RepID=UPI003C70AACE
MTAPPEPRPPRPRRWPALTTQGRLYLVLGALLLVVAGSVLVGSRVVARAQDRTDQLVDHIQPARSAAYQLHKALLDQETSVRGYVLTGKGEFLTPYDEGLRQAADRSETVRRLIADHPDLVTDVNDIERAGEAWRTRYARPLVDTVRTTGPSAVDADRLEAAKRAFDGLRTLFDRQEKHLNEARDEAREQLTQAQDQRDLALGAVVAAVCLTGLVVVLMVRRLVGVPLARLHAAADRVRGGAFAERIPAEGPADLRAVGTAVEEMRRRVVSELDAARDREALLARQAAELDEQAVELRRSNAELEQFAYVASHDLQEPLRKVASFCQLLEKRYGDQLDARGKQYIDFAVDGSKRMQVLINDLLTFSRVGRLDQARADTPLDAPLDRALRNLSGALQESGAELVRPTELPTLNCDPSLMAMLWQNLIGNAVKFRRPDVPCRIEITCERVDDHWDFAVTDNGIGVEEEFAEKVFVIFQRLHGREEYEGTGIGLALCRKIVEYHGGQIRLVPAPDGAQGTSIRFTLPAGEDTEPDRPTG